MTNLMKALLGRLKMSKDRKMARPNVDEGRSSHRSRGGHAVGDGQDRVVKDSARRPVGTSDYSPSVSTGNDVSAQDNDSKRMYRTGRPGNARMTLKMRKAGRA